jgi:RNA polymerase sigma-70 factor (ECF subfamily)
VLDEELWSQLKRGDPKALEALYDRHAPAVMAVARRLAHDPSLAEEIVQDVFTRLWTTTSFDPGLGRFDHWVATIARRVAIDHLRRTKRRADVPDSERVYAERGTDDQTPRRDPVGTELEGRALRRDLETALRTLRREETVIIEMAYFQGFTLSEIAERLDVPLGTVKTRLHHALRSLRLAMADWRTGVQG